MSDGCDIRLIELFSYLTGQTDSTEHDNLQRHLDAGCDPCNRNLESVGGFGSAIDHQAAVESSIYVGELQSEVQNRLTGSRRVLKKQLEPIASDVTRRKHLSGNRHDSRIWGGRGIRLHPGFDGDLIAVDLEAGAGRNFDVIVVAVEAQGSRVADGSESLTA